MIVRRLLFLVPLGAFVLLVAYFIVGLQRDPSLIPTVLVNRPVPEFELPPVEGYLEGFSSEDLKGEVSLVNIFGSWCIACQIEHPLLMELSEKNEIPIYGIDWKDPPGAGFAWLEENGDPYTKIGDDASGRVAIDFGVTGAPETFIVDRHGRIRYKQTGPITPLIWERDMAPIISKLREEN
jgi:cytochrome c biogenesis protein CcmG/thiol:disulfide interchange protein DsbE